MMYQLINSKNKQNTCDLTIRVNDDICVKFVHVRIHVYICMYVYIYTCYCMCVCIHVWWHLCQVCPCAYTCIYMYVCVHIYMLLCVRVYTCLYIGFVCVRVYIYIYIYMYIYIYIYVCVCACVYMFIYIHYILMRKQIMTNWSTTRKKDSPVIWKIASVDDDIRVRYV